MMITSEATPLLVDAASSIKPTVATTTQSGDTATAQLQQQHLNLQRARYYLYTSHFFAQFSQQSWEFSLTLFLAAFTNYQSLVLVSSYGIVTGFLIFTTGSVAGRYFVDTPWDRLSSTRFLVWTQNGCVMIGTILSFALLQLRSNQPDRLPTDFYSVALIVGLHIFGPLSTLLDKAFLVSIERDWVVVMGEYSLKLKNVDQSTSDTGTGIPSTTGIIHEQKKETTWLYETNVTMKQIDLGCRIAAPSLVGLTIGIVQGLFRIGVMVDNDHNVNNTSEPYMAYAALLIGMLNGTALFVEYICTFSIYHLIPTLAIKNPRNNPPTQSFSPAANTSLNALPTTQSEHSKANQNGQSCYAIVVDFCCNCRGRLCASSGMQTYLAQPISWAGISLSLLYFNTLTFGGLMTAYLLWRGMTLESVGFWRGVSSALGLAGTFAFRLSTKRMSLVTTGMWSITEQLLCIMASVTSFYVASYNLSITLLLFGVCASRIGLWVFDVAVTQLMQEFIPEGIRGSVGGTQNALNAFFQLSSFSLGYILPSPAQYDFFAIYGCVAVAVAALLFYTFIFKHKSRFITHSDRATANR